MFDTPVNRVKHIFYCITDGTYFSIVCVCAKNNRLHRPMQCGGGNGLWVLEPAQFPAGVFETASVLCVQSSLLWIITTTWPQVCSCTKAIRSRVAQPAERLRFPLPNTPKFSERHKIKPRLSRLIHAAVWGGDVLSPSPLTCPLERSRYIEKGSDGEKKRREENTLLFLPPFVKWPWCSFFPLWRVIGMCACLCCERGGEMCVCVVNHGFFC